MFLYLRVQEEVVNHSTIIFHSYSKSKRVSFFNSEIMMHHASFNSNFRFEKVESVFVLAPLFQKQVQDWKEKVYPAI